MVFREVPVFEVREVLRLWLSGRGQRPICRLAGVDRKTVRRYVDAAVGLGLERDGDDGQLSDEFVGLVCERVRSVRPDGHGEAWAQIAACHELVQGWVDKGLTIVKVHELLERRGVIVAYRTLHRYATLECGFGKAEVTVRVADGEPGGELQVDFGKMGLIFDRDADRRRTCHALVFTAALSRHTFVWLTFGQTTQDVIAGFEAAWTFFGGVFAVVIPDNLKAVVDRADPCDPRFNQTFIEYAQDRGFFVDPARVRSPKDKPRVERTVIFVRGSFFAGEDFVDLADAQRRAATWCAVRAGMRIHGTTQRRPKEMFDVEEAPKLSAAPTGRYDIPVYRDCKVHRDHHIEIAKALYSVPGDLIGETVRVRGDTKLVKVFCRGTLVKTHLRKPAGHRSTDPDDLPAERTVYAMRDLDYLKRVAAGYGEAIGVHTTTLLDNPLPWTKMRQVYRLLGLVKRYGADRVDTACGRALDVEVVDVGLIGRMLERCTETDTVPEPPVATNVVEGRFARDPDHFAVGRTGTDTTASGAGR